MHYFLLRQCPLCGTVNHRVGLLSFLFLRVSLAFVFIFSSVQCRAEFQPNVSNYAPGGHFPPPLISNKNFNALYSASYMFCPSHLPWFRHSNCIWGKSASYEALHYAIFCMLPVAFFLLFLNIFLSSENSVSPSASELYRPSDPRLSAKLVSTFEDSASRGQRNRCLRPYSRLSRPEPILFLPSSSSVVLTRLSGSRWED
jgi:hypothetical protein